MTNKIPVKVYKYRDWSNGFHKNILLHNELYLPSPKEINDPFDCRIPRNFITLTEEERDKYIKDLAEHFDKSDKRDIERRMSDLLSFQEFYEKKLYELQDKHYGILSLSARWNRILLWSHYSNNHQGICIGFWTNLLREFGPFNKYGIVQYADRFPDDMKPKIFENVSNDFVKEAYVQTHTKSSVWRYEKEVRFLKIFEKPDTMPFERLIHFPDEVISEVILGINISSSDKEEILEICRKKGIRVYTAKPVPFRFSITRDRIA
jgi:hypothetical protein